MDDRMFLSRVYFKSETVFDKLIGEIQLNDLTDPFKSDGSPEELLKRLISACLCYAFDRMLKPLGAEKHQKFALLTVDFEGKIRDLTSEPDLIDITKFRVEDWKNNEFGRRCYFKIFNALWGYKEFETKEIESIFQAVFVQIVRLKPFKPLSAFFERKKTYEGNWEDRLAYEKCVCLIIQEPIPLEEEKHEISLLDIYVKRHYQYNQLLNYNDRITRSVMDEKEYLEDVLFDWLASGKLKVRGVNKSNVQLLIVCGTPGQGKSSFCQQIAFRYWKDTTQRLARDLVYIDFTKLKQIRLNTGEKITLKSLLPDEKSEAAFLLRMNEVLKKYWYEIREDSSETPAIDSLKNKFIVLDGLEELENDLESQTIEEWIKLVLNRVHTSSKVLITARTGYVSPAELNRKATSPISMVEFESLEESSQQKIAQAYYEKVYGEALSQTRLDTLYEFKDFIRHPYLLFKAVDFCHDKKLGKEVNTLTDALRYDLFDQILDAIFNHQWKKGLNIEPLRQSQVSVKITKYKSDLKILACQMHRTGKDMIPVKELEGLDIFAPETYGYENLSKVKFLMISFYFQKVVVEGEEYIQFYHDFAYHFLTAAGYVRELEKILEESQEAKVKAWYAVFSANLFSEEILGYFRLHFFRVGDRNGLKPGFVKLVNNYLALGYEPESGNDRILAVKDSLLATINTFFSILMFGQLLRDGSKESGNWYLPQYGPREKDQEFARNGKFNYQIKRFQFLLHLLFQACNYTIMSARSTVNSAVRFLSFEEFDFSDFDLSGTTFIDLNFKSSKFSKTILTGAYFINCTFEKSDFKFANLERVRFEQCSFVSVNLDETDLEHCIITKDNEWNGRLFSDFGEEDPAEVVFTDNYSFDFYDSGSYYRLAKTTDVEVAESKREK